MRSSTSLFGLALTIAATPTSGFAQEASAHAIVELVADRYPDTPEARGLLPTALAEAEIAAEYAALAGADSTVLSARQRYAGYVLHAMDPAVVSSGPGLGYGLRPAAGRVAQEMQRATVAEDASENVRVHGRPIAEAAANAGLWAEEAVALASRLRQAAGPDEAARLGRELASLTDMIVRGVDGNGDGRRGWPDGDLGLRQAAWHMTLLRRAEGLAR